MIFVRVIVNDGDERYPLFCHGFDSALRCAREYLLKGFHVDIAQVWVDDENVIKVLDDK